MINKRLQLLKQLNYFWLFNAFLLILIGLHYWVQIFPLNMALSLTGKILVLFYLALAYLGQMSLLAYAPAILIVPLLYLWPRRSFIYGFSILLSTAIAFFILIDTFIYNQYQFHISGIIWHMILSGASDEIFDFTWVEKAICGAIVTGLFLLEILFAYLTIKKDRKNIGFKPIGSILGVLFLSYFFVAYSTGFEMYRQFIAYVRFVPYYLEVLSEVSFGLINNKEINSVGAAYLVQPHQITMPLNYPLSPMICKPPPKPLNIVIIMIDTWRFDMLTQAVTPHIYQFSKLTTQYFNHSSGGNCTQPGVFSFFYSIPATYWDSTIAAKQSPVFINELLKSNYNMGVYGSAPLSLPAFDENIFSKVPNLKSFSVGANPAERDKYITKEFATFISKQTDQKPFFSFLFYDSAHTYCSVPNLTGPFKPAIAVCNRLTLTHDSNPVPYINRYKNALYLIDGLVDQDLTMLKQKGFLNNTVIIITGDHGNEFNDNHLGYWGHASNFTHFQVQTPLLIYYPGQKPALVQYPTSHFDVVPTLMTKLFNCQTPIADYSVGKLLTDPTQKPYLIVGSYIDFGIVEPNQIINIFPGGQYQVVDKTDRPIANAVPSDAVMRQVFKDMRRFYKK